MKFLKRFIALAVLLPAFCALSGVAEPTTQPIDDAIAHLGDPDPTVREHATKVLREAGPAARKALEEAAKGDDPEVAARAQELLRAVPAGPATTKAEPDEELSDVTLYRAANAPAKQQIIDRLKTTTDGTFPLTRLWGIETDQELRGAIFDELLKRWSSAAAILLGDGSITSSELLLTTAVDHKETDSAPAYAAYWRSRGRLDEMIRRWASRGGKQPPDTWAEQVLSSLYRAKGDAKAAIAHAEACDDPQVLLETLLWAGDWARLAVELRKGNPAVQTPNDMGIIIGMESLAGDEKAVDADLPKLNALVHTENDAHAAADALLLVNRPDEAAKVLIDEGQYATAYDLLSDRGRFDEAAALLAAHDGETSAEAISLRAVAAKEYGRLGLTKQRDEMIQRITKENAEIKFPRVSALLAEAERDAGMTEKAWLHFGDAIENCGEFGGGIGLTQQGVWYVTHAFPSKDNGVEWFGIWATYFRGRRHRPIRELFEKTRREYDGSMPIEELKAIVSGVDLTSERLQPFIKLAWEAAVRMRKAGHEDDAVDFVMDLAPRASGCELYIGLGDWAAEKNDWGLAADRYAMAWRKERTSALAMYLQGWAMERGGRVSEGRERMQLAHLLPLGDEKRREELISGLIARRLDDAAVREADLLIRTGHPLSSGSEVALRTAAERAEERGDAAVANALWQRTLTSFLYGTYTFRFEPAYLHLPDMVRRAHARALLAAGDWEGAQRDVKTCTEMLPIDCAIGIDLVPDLDKLGKHAEADALFAKQFAVKQSICDRYPDSAWHHNECAWLAAKCDRELDKALVHAKRAVELDPTNAADIDTLAEVYFHQKHFKEAVELEKKCVEISPNEPIHRKQLERFEAGGK